MNDLPLNNPTTRQALLRQRLKLGGQLIALELAEEFGISPDTIRRDLLVLEEEGLVQRVRGGALSVSRPETTYAERKATSQSDCSELVEAALSLIEPGMTVMFDGGTTLVRLAERLPSLPDLMVVTPSPVVAAIMLDKGIATHLVGGRLSPWGGVAVGGEAETALSNLAADLAFVGVCAFDNAFGLSSEDPDEAGIMRAMARSASRVVMLLKKDKLGRRARHRALTVEQISIIITDAGQNDLILPADRGTEIIHVN